MGTCGAADGPWLSLLMATTFHLPLPLQHRARLHQGVRIRELLFAILMILLFTLAAALQWAMGITGIVWFELHNCTCVVALYSDMRPLVLAIGSLFMCVVGAGKQVLACLTCGAQLEWCAVCSAFALPPQCVRVCLHLEKSSLGPHGFSVDQLLWCTLQLRHPVHGCSAFASRALIFITSFSRVWCNSHCCRRVPTVSRHSLDVHFQTSDHCGRA